MAPPVNKRVNLDEIGSDEDAGQPRRQTDGPADEDGSESLSWDAGRSPRKKARRRASKKKAGKGGFGDLSDSGVGYSGTDMRSNSLASGGLSDERADYGDLEDGDDERSKGSKKSARALGAADVDLSDYYTKAEVKKLMEKERERLFVVDEALQRQIAGVREEIKKNGRHVQKEVGKDHEKLKAALKDLETQTDQKLLQ